MTASPAEARAYAEAEKDYQRAAIDVVQEGSVRITSLVAKKRRKEDAENYDRMVAARPLNPPPHRFSERTVGPGELEARKFKRREAWTYITEDMLASNIMFGVLPGQKRHEPHSVTVNPSSKGGSTSRFTATRSLAAMNKKRSTT
jgi:hypothetical protein